MGYYTAYMKKNMNESSLKEERKAQLRRIREIRGGDVLVFATALDKTLLRQALSIDYPDLVALRDVVPSLTAKSLTLILETPGGSGEIVEDIVDLLRAGRDKFSVIVPGWAKSAGTILAMGADELLMEPHSSLGPIDAQIIYQGKAFSADALLEGFNKIKREMDEPGKPFSKAYVPILQGLSPGELQAARNAKHFAIELVAKWLTEYKFKTWTAHSSDGRPVTEEERRLRAEEVAKKLSAHSEWLTHGRSIKLKHLRTMKLQVTDYSETPDLAEAIGKYFALLRLTFDKTDIFKLIETPDGELSKRAAAATGSGRVLGPAGTAPRLSLGSADVDLRCPRCQNVTRLQLSVGEKKPPTPGRVPWPQDDRMSCPKCGIPMPLKHLRVQLQQQLGVPG